MLGFNDFEWISGSYQNLTKQAIGIERDGGNQGILLIRGERLRRRSGFLRHQENAGHEQHRYDAEKLSRSEARFRHLPPP